MLTVAAIFLIKRHLAMLVILVFYLILVWLFFSKLKLARWGRRSGAITVIIGALVLAVFQAMFNHLTPSGSFVIVSRVVEITPNVAGLVVEVPVKSNEPVKVGDILLQIDRTPYQYKVNQLEASLAQAQQQVKQLQASYEQAAANAEGLVKQLDFHTKRIAEYQLLVTDDAQSQFRYQDVKLQYETVLYQLQAAKAAESNAKLAKDSQIGGINTTVA